MGSIEAVSGVAMAPTDSIPQAPPLSPKTSNLYAVEEHPLGEARPLRVICIGGGATGLNLAYQIGRHLKNVDLQIYEKNEALGGTWLENKYPGVACDIPAHNYQFLWALNPDWSEFYASGAEIWRYFNDTAAKFGLNKYIKLKHEVKECQWDEELGKWKVTVYDHATGRELHDKCDVLINGGGFLNHWRWPEITGLKTFQGEMLHSASWNDKVNLDGKRIAVIGNGSSGIQLVTALQPTAKKLTTFIRSPTWVSTSFATQFAGPNGENFKYSEEKKETFRTDKEKFLAYRKEIEKDMNGHFRMNIADSAEQEAAKQYLSEMMRTRLGKDHPLTNRLIPDFGVGCRRPSPGVGYLESLVKDNVQVEFRAIAEIVENGIKLVTGEVLELDAIICATGFDVSWRPRFPVIGRGGIDMSEQWKARPTAYLSLAVANFPNYFLFLGPNSPLSHGSALPSIEHTTKYILRVIHKMQTQGYKSIEPLQESVDDFIMHADTFLQRTVWASKCRSWLKGGTEDGPPLVHPGSRLHWFQMLLEPRWEDFKWTRHNPNRFAYLGNGHSTMEEEGKDLSWYLNDPDQGYENVVY